DHLLLQMKNAYEKEMLFDSVTGLPKSIKGKDHGLGMKSISAFSEKIGGNIGCFCENGIFHIMIFAKF
ncbi:MAG: ATP-binding protein, partial [Lachnospiraceae bacterium]|nr:ATP-binding protein [Lachnospiraceae bacterium]